MALAIEEADGDEVPPLCELCRYNCAEHLSILAEMIEGRYVLKPDIVLPVNVCQDLLRLRKELGHALDDAFMHLFATPGQTGLRRVNLKYSNITDRSMSWLLKHKLVELDVSNCYGLTSETVKYINLYGDQLLALFIGNSTQIFEKIDIKEYSEECEENVDDSLGRDYIFKCPRLKALSVHELSGSGVHDTIATLLNPLKSLNYLDISSCEVTVELMDCLDELHLLQTLILFDVPINDIQLAFEKIGSLKNLRTLDFSQGKDMPVMYEDPEVNLKYLVSMLPKLDRLDLSGTNLPGFLKPEELIFRITKQAKTEQGSPNKICSVPGLEGRHFELLGLFNCSYSACDREDIPANQVAGSANDEQTLTALQLYMDRPTLLVRVLNHLFSNARTATLKSGLHRSALQLLTNAMKKHPYEKSIQISGSASMFYLVKGPERSKYTARFKREVIRVLLNGMQQHQDDSVMLRNGCLTLCHFKIPQDVLFVYPQMVRILLDMVVPERHESFVQRIGIHLLNCLCCQVEGHEKKLVGDLQAIKMMLEIIEYKVRHNECDEMLETAWSTMWNVTDETPANCQRFLHGRGMQLFLRCLEQWPDKEELIRNMMGLMGNVAEVEELRPLLMQPQFVTVFSQLLESQSDGIEVSYNACGVLAHLAFDGPHVWKITEPCRGSVLHKMQQAIDRWDINSNRNINYRSFEPILRLLPANHTPQAQHWAVWALCNLTNVYAAKYCPLVEKENGLILLQEVIDHSNPYKTIKILAKQVIDRVKNYKGDPLQAQASMDTDREDG